MVLSVALAPSLKVVPDWPSSLSKAARLRQQSYLVLSRHNSVDLPIILPLVAVLFVLPTQ